jgi:hypothetical protein
MSEKIRKYKIKGMPSEKEFMAMPFGRQLDHFQTIKQFKAESKSTHLSQKRQPYQKAIREAVKLLGATEWYCDFYCDANCKDDSFEFWYRS